MAAAESAAKYLGLDELLLIRAGIPPHKMLSADAAGADDRLAMTRLMGEQIALDTGVKVTVSDMEIARGGKSYTADTLRILHEEHPDDELWLLMGTDMFLTFQYWYKPDEIVRYAGPVRLWPHGKGWRGTFRPAAQVPRPALSGQPRRDDDAVEPWSTSRRRSCARASRRGRRMGFWPPRCWDIFTASIFMEQISI